MAAESQLAVRLGLAEFVTADRVTQALARAGLPNVPRRRSGPYSRSVNSDKESGRAVEVCAAETDWRGDVGR